MRTLQVVLMDRHPSTANEYSPDSAQSQVPAASSALMSAVCDIDPTAALTKPIVPSSASPALSGTPPTNPILPQHAAPDAPPSTQLSPSEAKRGGKAPAEGYAPPWYALKRAANAATGQAGAPQPWWKLDSWLTAPAEAHYQRSASFHMHLEVQRMRDILQMVCKPGVCYSRFVRYPEQQ